MKTNKNNDLGSDQSKGQSRITDNPREQQKKTGQAYGKLNQTRRILGLYTRSRRRMMDYSRSENNLIKKERKTDPSTVKNNLILMFKMICPQSKEVLDQFMKKKLEPKIDFSKQSFLNATDKRFSTDVRKTHQTIYEKIRGRPCRVCIRRVLNDREPLENCSNCILTDKKEEVNLVQPGEFMQDIFGHLEQSVSKSTVRKKNGFVHNKMLFTRTTYVLPLIAQKMMMHCTFFFYQVRLPKIVQKSNMFATLGDSFLIPKENGFGWLSYDSWNLQFKVDTDFCNHINAIFSRAILHWKKNTVIVFNILNQMFYSYNCIDKEICPKVKLEDCRIEDPFFLTKNSRFRDLQKDPQTIVWMILIDDHIFLCSTDKGNIYLVDLKYKFSRLVGHLWVNGGPALIRQIEHIGNGFCVGIADDYLIEFKLAFEKPDFKNDERVTIRPEKLCKSFFDRYENYLREMHGSIARNEHFIPLPFFNVVYKDSGPLSLKKDFQIKQLTKDDFGTDHHLISILLEKMKNEELRKKCLEDKHNIQKYQIFPRILDKFQLMENQKIPNFKSLRKIEHFGRILKYHQFGIIVRFDTSTFEIRFEINAKPNLEFCRVQVPGKITNAIVNDLLDQLLIVCFDETRQKYTLYVYDLYNIITKYLLKMNIDK